MKRKIALVLEYEGTAYAGFQRQANAPSVQGVVEEACRLLTGMPILIKGAGRTDAGVHALGQVIAFETEAGLSVHQFSQGLNHFLPADVAVRAAYEVPLDFDPRRQATSRVYQYTFLCGRGRSPLRRRFVCPVEAPLDLRAMREALAWVEGERDFAPFSGPLTGGKTAVRRLLRSAVWQEGDEVHVEFEGNAFLPQQVRRLAGALLQVGLGKQTIAKFRALADSGIRGAAHQVLPAQGLCLRHVYYQSFPPRDYARQSSDNTSDTRSGELTLAGR